MRKALLCFAVLAASLVAVAAQQQVFRASRSTVIVPVTVLETIDETIVRIQSALAGLPESTERTFSDRGPPTPRPF